MRILFDHQIFALQQYGGISRYVSEIADRIAGMAGHQVEIFAPIYLNEYLSALGGVHPLGVKIPRLFGLGRVVAWGMGTSLAYLNVRRRRNVDIFHETYYSAVDCRPHSAKRVITVYDMIPEKFIEASTRRNRLRRIRARAIRRADHVICISESTRRDVMELLDVPEKKTSVVYLGYSLDLKGGTIEHRRPEKPLILYVGRRRGYKNFDRLIRVYASSPFLKNEFAMICFGGERFSGREYAQMKLLGLSRTSIRHVSGPDSVLAGLYASAAAFIYPSMYEGFGIPPLEAMSFGCPVVCANTSSLPEVVGDAAELFDPANDAEMRMAIEKVVSSSMHAALLIKRGRERIKRFSWEKCAQETLDVYMKVLKG